MDLSNFLRPGSSSLEANIHPAVAHEEFHPADTTLPFLFEELLINLGAEAIGLLQYTPGKRQAVMLLACGEWQRWSGTEFAISRDQSTYVSATGESQLEHSYLSSTRTPLTESSAALRFLYHTPIKFGGTTQTVLWIGKIQRWGTKILPLLGMLNDLIAHSMESKSLKSGVCENLPDLARQLSEWDSTLYQHSLRMLPWIQATAQALDMGDYDSQLACWAGLLHDIGKVSVPRRILDKAGPLTVEEWAVIKLHPGIGARIVPHIKTLTSVREIIHTHHEHYGGLGYPLGLTGDMIPLPARILAVVDAYAAMTEDRPYRPACSPSEAAARLRQDSGRQFDPEVCSTFLSIL